MENRTVGNTLVGKLYRINSIEKYTIEKVSNSTELIGLYSLCIQYNGLKWCQHN